MANFETREYGLDEIRRLRDFLFPKRLGVFWRQDTRYMALEQIQEAILSSGLVYGLEEASSLVKRCSGGGMSYSPRGRVMITESDRHKGKVLRYKVQDFYWGERE